MSKTARMTIILVVAAGVAAVFAFKSYKQEVTPPKVIAAVPSVAVPNDPPAAPAALPSAPTALPSAPAALPLLLDLGSRTCIPCKKMMPVLEEVKNEYAGKLRVEFIDVKENPDAGEKYNLSVIPTQIFFDASGKELFRHKGFFPKEEILKKWEKLGVPLRGEGVR
jgi:thioredoxin 1